MDISKILQSKSDQMNAADLMGGPITVTIENVTAGTTEQPLNIHLKERPGRAYRPGLTMRRVIAEGWGTETDAWIGRRLTLYRDPNVSFGRDETGGIRISHMSHIPREFTLSLQESRRKFTPRTIKPLPDEAPTTLAMPELSTPEEAREYWAKRKAEGATDAELEEIAAVGKTLQNG